MENGNSGIFGLTSNDLIKSAVSAVFAAVVVALAGIVAAPGFDVFAMDWNMVLKLVVNVSISTLIGDIGRRFMTDSQGKLFGVVG